MYSKTIMIVATLVSMPVAMVELALADQQPAKPSIAVLGTGDMGDSFGPRLASLGYRVIYGSRNPDSQRVQALVKETGHGASSNTNTRAASDADVILLAIGARGVESVVTSLQDIEGKPIIDMTWPPTYTGEDGYDIISIDTSNAERIQSWQPDAKVVKAFGTIGSQIVDNPQQAGGLVSIPIASDHRDAKETAAQIAFDLGMDPVDAGPLRMARHIESMMMLYMVPHYQNQDAGWEFYFRRTSYWRCNSYEGGEFEEGAPEAVDANDFAIMPSHHEPIGKCPDT